MLHSIQFLATTTTVVGLGILLLLAGGITWWLKRTGRTNRHPLLVFAALASVALIVSVTLIRDRPAFTPGQLLNWSASGWQRISYDPLGNAENILNVTLFIPAGVAWTLLTGRPLRVLAALLGLSLTVECLQAITAAGANDIADVVANTAGAAIGVLVGTVVRWLLQTRHGSPPSRRQLTLTAGSVLAVVAVAIGAGFLGAAHRQSTLEQELISRFAGTTLAEYRTWEAKDHLNEAVFETANGFADGAQHFDDTVRVRYPASFFGLPRCVFVEWRPEAVEISRGAGADCTEFIG